MSSNEIEILCELFFLKKLRGMGSGCSNDPMNKGRRARIVSEKNWFARPLEWIKRGRTTRFDFLASAELMNDLGLGGRQKSRQPVRPQMFSHPLRVQWKWSASEEGFAIISIFIWMFHGLGAAASWENCLTT